MPRRATACCGSPVMSRSPNQTRPEVGTVSPEMSRKNVVLPAPLGPMIERSSPRRTVMSTRSTAMRLPKARVSASVRSRCASGIGANSTGSSKVSRRGGATRCAIVLAMDALALPPLSAAQADVVARVTELARTRFAPRAARYDAESSFPHDNYRDLHAAGLLPLTVPRAYGGVGADPIAYVHALREMAWGCSATALTFNMHSTITGFIDALGTEAQKRRWFADVVERGRLIASITSEPEQSFRDKFVLNTVFRRADGGWRVAGVKQFCSIGDAADYYFVTGVVEGTSSAAEVGLEATTRALQLAGGRGILKELPLERWHRDALAGPVMPPSNDRCLETAGKLLCGLRAATLEFQ